MHRNIVSYQTLIISHQKLGQNQHFNGLNQNETLIAIHHLIAILQLLHSGTRTPGATAWL